MESLKLSFEAVTPIFLMMLLGYTLKRIKFVQENVFDAINKMVFWVFLPLLLFYNIYSTRNLSGFENTGRLFLFTIISVMAVFFLGLISVFFITKQNAKRAVILQSLFRTNFAILGVPVVSYICKDNITGLSSLMVALVVPLFNILAVACFEIFNGRDEKAGNLLKGIISNPLIIGCFAGILFLVFKINLPHPIEKTISDISKVASPLAIITLGAGFAFKDIKGCIKENVIVILVRLVLIPIIVLSVAAYMGFAGEAFACLMVAFAGPVAVSSYSTAQQMGGDKTLASQFVVLTSALCIATLFIWIFVFSNLGVI